MVLLCALIAIACSLLWYFWKLRATYWERKGFPCLKYKFPYGSCKEYSAYSVYQGYSIKKIYEDLSPHPYGGILAFLQPQLVIRDPEIVKLILTKDFSYFRDRGRELNTSSDPMTQSVFNLHGVLWRAIRLKLTPLFTSGKLKGMFSDLLDASLLLSSGLKEAAVEESPVDIKEIVAQYTTQVLVGSFFGVQGMCINNPESDFRKIMPFIFPSKMSFLFRMKLLLYTIFPGLDKIYRFSWSAKESTVFIQELYANIVKSREACSSEPLRQDLINVLHKMQKIGSIELNDVTGYGLKDDFFKMDAFPDLLAAQCFFFFAAGSETASVPAAYCLYELAKRPEIQDRLIEEIDSVPLENMTFQSLHNMRYLEQVAQESMRILAPIPLITRKCIKDYRVPNTELIIEKGTKIIIPVHAIQNDPSFFPNPEVFDPERFSPENRPKIHKYAFIPFGEGPRQCMGIRFGTLQLKMAIYGILSKYRVELCPDTCFNVTNIPTFIVAPVGCLKLKLKHRKD